MLQELPISLRLSCCMIVGTSNIPAALFTFRMIGVSGTMSIRLVIFSPLIFNLDGLINSYIGPESPSKEPYGEVLPQVFLVSLSFWWEASACNSSTASHAAAHSA